MALADVTPQTGQRERNTFLDMVRAVAILRVVVWHTYGVAWISYFVASMPAMFFLAGSLMAYSLRDGNALNVLFRRFRRMLIPFWLIGLVAIYAMLVYEQESTAAAAGFDAKHLIWWLFPVWDPAGSEWGLTFWAPLWYLRCLTWLLLASPILLWLWRRLGPGLLFIPLVGLTVAEQRLHNGLSVPWQLQDAALYGFFWLLGFAYNDGLLSRISTFGRAVLCGMAISVAAWWATNQYVPEGVVNASYPLHLFVGLAWLFGALTLEDAIARFAARPRVADVLYWVNERALTIYLWQSLGLFAMYEILWQSHHSSLTRNLLALPIVASITFLATLLFGWLEDIAAKRPARIWPTRLKPQAQAQPQWERPHQRPSLRLALPSLVVAAAGLVALFVATSNIVREPSHVVQATVHTVPPSGVGLHYRAQKAEVSEAPVVRPVSARTDPVTPEELQEELEKWLEQWQLTGATATLLRASGETWTGASGIHDAETEVPFETDEPYSIASVTKTFTAAMILRLVDHKKISLNDKASKYVPAFPDSDKFTIKQLLQHTSGLIPGDDQPNKAIAEAAIAGLQFQPGTSYLYSRTGYYILGLVIERVTGMSYASALRQQILDPLQLTSTYMDEDVLPAPESTHPYELASIGYAGVLGSSGAGASKDDQSMPIYDYHGYLWSAGGLWSNTDDLARWGLDLWDSDKVISRSSRQAMTTFLGPEFDYTGLGTYPFCPCWEDKGQLQAERWGFVGVTGSLEYDPVDRIAVAVRMSGTILDDNVLNALDDFSNRMRQLVRERPFAAE